MSRLTSGPWLAADPTLAPWPDPDHGRVVEAGAWILADATLAAEAGAPQVIVFRRRTT